MFSKNVDKRISRAENLWNNLCAYKMDSAKSIDKLYNHDLSKIIETLQDFPELSAYSGHRSGKSSDGVNQSAMSVLDKAIQYLKDQRHACELKDVGLSVD
ncbi:hypothetical protein [Legionella waltersii]|uniref:Uncharacterized protein n=1 Tax=Legionella waltersii TaxID=66969 RepID=A0A0W1AB60_9GAMM|nr:hypothetical protein [Legionella waltersii]KTD78577.1 hypothetical protein Lwal_1740 [Legionella waltersii]SNV11531.1 Uncharacterised protein [Legionella waltersii]